MPVASSPGAGLASLAFVKFRRRRSHRASPQPTIKTSCSRLLILVWACVCLLRSPATALASCEVYVDARSPYCSDPAVGTIDRPYCSIAAALRDHGEPGAEIIVRPGIYREQVQMPSGGVVSPLILRASGPGVVIECADDLSQTSSWIPFTGDIWLAPSVTWRPRQVFSDGTRLTAAATDSASLPVNTFKHVLGQGLYVRTVGNPGRNTLLVGRRAHGFEMTRGGNVRIEGFTIRHAEVRGIQLESVRDVIVAGDTVAFSYSHGAQVSDGVNVSVERCQFADNGNHGLFLLRTRYSQVLENESMRNLRLADRAANGIHLRESSENRVSANRAHDNQDTGIHIQTESNQNLLTNNRTWLNGDHGFDLLRTHGTLLVGGTSYGNRNDGISVEGGSTGTRVFNTLSHDNGTRTNHYDLYVDSLSSSGFESNDNLFWNNGTQRPIRYRGVSYATVTAFTAATGHDARSIHADPQFENPGSGDFRLRSGSPAIDSGNSDVSRWPAEDAIGRLRFDDPDRNNLGLGPVSYADRGALEYRGVEKPVIDSGPVLQSGLSRAMPNPTDGRVEFQLELAAEALVEYRVLDVTGREVFGSRERRPAGRSILCWYGDNRNGIRVRPGIYIADVRVDGVSFVRRLTLLR